MNLPKAFSSAFYRPRFTFLVFTYLPLYCSMPPGTMREVTAHKTPWIVGRKTANKTLVGNLDHSVVTLDIFKDKEFYPA